MWGRSNAPARGVTLIVGMGVLAAASLAGVALAHGGSLRGAAVETIAAPQWLLLLTGGGVVGGSFLLATFMTDRGFVEEVHRWQRTFLDRGATDALATDALASVARVGGVLGLGTILVAGFFGPADPLSNAAILLVWVGWWSGFTMTTYLLGNSWPMISPWRTLSRWIPVESSETIPERLGVWPAVAGLLVLVWVEVVSPLADDPRLLAWIVLLYTAFTLAGASRYGSKQWFSTVDPVSRVFHTFGRLAPVQRTSKGVAIKIPGSALSKPDSPQLPGQTAFVIALLWTTTYDGLVATPAWTEVARAVVEGGMPPQVLYLGSLLAGFGLFYGGFRLAARHSRRAADTYLTAKCIVRWFAPSLIPIAAGYHLAHFLGYFLALVPPLARTLARPLAPSTPTVLVLPAWFAGLELWFVLAGHLLAIWVAHTTAYRMFPGRLQAVRSQYPLIAVMVLYTVGSLWIISQPTVTPPFL